eukprot:UN27307
MTEPKCALDMTENNCALTAEGTVGYLAVDGDGGDNSSGGDPQTDDGDCVLNKSWSSSGSTPCTACSACTNLW